MTYYDSTSSSPRTHIEATATSRTSIPVGSLLSPPEFPLHDSFSSCQKQKSPMKPIGNPAQQLPSPSNSPSVQLSQEVTLTTAGHDATDPILFSDADEPTGPAEPLFQRSPISPGAIPKHIAARVSAPLPKNVSPPTESQYRLFSDFIVTSWSDSYNKLETGEERRAYLEVQRAQAKQDDAARKQFQELQSLGQKRATAPKYPHRKHKTLAARPIRPSSSGSDGSEVVTSATGPQNSDSRVIKPATSRAGRRTIAPARHDSLTPEAGPSRETKRSTTGKVQVTDDDFRHIPDYCPNFTMTNGKEMTILSRDQGRGMREWSDADRMLLHLLNTEEQDLACYEQLGAANYLAAKRRIFVDRLYFYHFEKEQNEELAKQGRRDKPFVKNFLKTHAQDAAKMDVNKSSRLHTAFESVGWLDKSWCRGLPKPTFDNTKDREFTAEDYKSGLPGPQKHFKSRVVVTQV